MRARRWLCGCAVIALGAFPSVASGQTESIYHTACTLPVDAQEAVRFADPAKRASGASAQAACLPSERTARFDVTFEGFSADAEAAFRAALNTWACEVVSDIPIRVTARWTPLGATTLGNAGPFLFRNFPSAPTSGTWYPAALADVFAGRDLNPGQPDIQAEFNSAFGAWHLDHTTAPAPNEYDLYTVVLHELAHGLGFIGGMRVQSGIGRVGDPAAALGPYTYDRRTEDADGVSLLNSNVYPDNSAQLGNALLGSVFFDGPAVQSVRGAPAPLYAPPVWSTGGSYSHLDESAFPPGVPDGLMTPFVTRGETYEAPGAVTCGILFDIGWEIAGGCAALVGNVGRAGTQLTARLSGPNPFKRTTSVRVESPSNQQVRAVLVDALGREVSVLSEASVDGTLEIPVDGARLATGVYRVVVTGASNVASVPIVVIR